MKNHLQDPSVTMEFTVEDTLVCPTISEEMEAQIFETSLAEMRLQRALLQKTIEDLQNEIAATDITKILAEIERRRAPLDPAIWSMLPEELLQLIFARLPVRQIADLRLLSKTWDRYVRGETPGFTQLYAERYPDAFTRLTGSSTKVLVIVVTINVGS